MNCPMVGLTMEKQLPLFHLLYQKFHEHYDANNYTIIILFDQYETFLL